LPARVAPPHLRLGVTWPSVPGRSCRPEGMNAMACRAVAEAGISAATASLDVEAEWPLLLVAGWLTTAADLMVEAALMEAALA
jgi:hypothetical protein